jgi:hypothetical protein
MKIKEVIQTWVFDLVASGLGVALIVWGLEIKLENSFWWIAFISGIILNIPTIYFKLGKYIEELIEGISK